MKLQPFRGGNLAKYPCVLPRPQRCNVFPSALCEAFVGLLARTTCGSLGSCRVFAKLDTEFAVGTAVIRMRGMELARLSGCRCLGLVVKPIAPVIKECLDHHVEEALPEN